MNCNEEVDRKLEIGDERFVLDHEIRIGGFDKLYAAHESGNLERKFAIKLVKYKPRFDKEVLFLRRLKGHENIVQIFDHCTTELYGYIFMDMAVCNFSRLFQHQDYNKQCNRNLILYVLRSVAGALAFIHFKKIIYLDLKLENLLVFDDGNLKLCDFGLSQQMDGSGKAKEPWSIASLAYLSPELVQYYLGNKKPYNSKVDSFSFGSFAHELLFGKSRACQMRIQDRCEILKNQNCFFENFKNETNPFEIGTEVTELLKSCLEKIPGDRKGMDECSKFLKEIEFNEDDAKSIIKYLTSKVVNASPSASSNSANVRTTSGSSNESSTSSLSTERSISSLSTERSKSSLSIERSTSSSSTESSTSSSSTEISRSNGNSIDSNESINNNNCENNLMVSSDSEPRTLI